MTSNARPGGHGQHQDRSVGRVQAVGVVAVRPALYKASDDQQRKRTKHNADRQVFELYLLGLVAKCRYPDRDTDVGDVVYLHINIMHATFVSIQLELCLTARRRPVGDWHGVTRCQAGPLATGGTLVNRDAVQQWLWKFKHPLLMRFGLHGEAVVLPQRGFRPEAVDGFGC